MNPSPSYKYIVMTPILTGDEKSIYAEKKHEYDEQLSFYVASGENMGIIINHENSKLQFEKPDSNIQLECYCEKRSFKFWFADLTAPSSWLTTAYSFYNDLVDKKSLPKDYVGFIKKFLKMLQLSKYQSIARLKLDFLPVNDISPESLQSPTETNETDNKRVLSDKEILQILQQRLEESYPSSLTIEDLMRFVQVNDASIIRGFLDQLEKEGLIESMKTVGKKGENAFIRKIQLKNHRVCELGAEQVDKALYNEKPTIAIISNLLVEKIAVDSMISNKTTYTKYKTDGDSHVYTIGQIGKHKVISTKLPTVGRDMNARISSGNITTRLLGTFQSLSHILLVGVAGGVQHMHEFEKHSRLGDILVSCPSHLTYSNPLLLDTAAIEEKNISATDLANPLYILCDRVNEAQDSEIKEATESCKNFAYETYGSREKELMEAGKKVSLNFLKDPSKCCWAEYLSESMSLLSKECSEYQFTKPPPECDKIKYRDMLIAQPKVPEEFQHLYQSDENLPLVRFGCFGAGRPVVDNDQLRDEFASEFRLLAFDAEFDQVIQSIMGNGVHSYLFIRGISDYTEGRHNQEWQPYSALTAASFMKALLMHLEPVKA